MAGRRPLLSFGKIFHKTTTASIVQSCTTLDLSDRLCLVHTLYLPLLIYCTVFGRSVVQPGMQALLIGTAMYFVKQASRLRLLQSVYWHIGKKVYCSLAGATTGWLCLLFTTCPGPTHNRPPRHTNAQSKKICSFFPEMQIY